MNVFGKLRIILGGWTVVACEARGSFSLSPNLAPFGGEISVRPALERHLKISKMSSVISIEVVEKLSCMTLPRRPGLVTFTCQSFLHQLLL